MDRFCIKGCELEVVFAQERRKSPNEMRGRVVNQQNDGDGGRDRERSSSFERHQKQRRRDEGRRRDADNKEKDDNRSAEPPMDEGGKSKSSKGTDGEA